MRKLMKNATAGSTLIEVVLAITILGLVSAPICSSLVLAARINARSREVMTAQLNVSSAVERLMAEGLAVDTSDDSDWKWEKECGLAVVAVNHDKSEENVYYNVTVSDRESDPLVTVTTTVKAAPPETGGGA